mmetsp:Transcript_45893/g.127353  ORF Transcript_45893/g.127353 Transcript_45893/m.127353 type:complete len:294 (+) Transcript_45893:33-914(+)
MPHIESRGPARRGVTTRPNRNAALSLPLRGTSLSWSYRTSSSDRCADRRRLLLGLFLRLRRHDLVGGHLRPSNLPRVLSKRRVDLCGSVEGWQWDVRRLHHLPGTPMDPVLWHPRQLRTAGRKQEGFRPRWNDRHEAMVGVLGLWQILDVPERLLRSSGLRWWCGLRRRSRICRRAPHPPCSDGARRWLHRLRIWDRGVRLAGLLGRFWRFVRFFGRGSHWQLLMESRRSLWIGVDSSHLHRCDILGVRVEVVVGEFAHLRWPSRSAITHASDVHEPDHSRAIEATQERATET